MANDVKIGFGIDDNASPGIKRIGGNIDSMTKLGLHGIKRMSGEMGSTMLNALGINTAMGKVGLAIGASVALMSLFSKAMTRELENVKEQTDWWQKKVNLIRDAKKANEALAAGGISQAGGVRKLLSLGGSMSDVESTKARGVSHEDAIATETGLRMLPERQRAKYEEKIRNMVAHGIDPQAAITSLVKSNGNMDNALVDIWGLRPSKENKQKAWRFMTANGPALNNISNAVSSSGVVPGAQAGMLTSGATTSAIDSSNKRTLDPLGTARNEIRQQITDTQVALKKQRDAQEDGFNAFSGLLKVLANTATLGQTDNYMKLGEYSENAKAFGD